MLNISVHLSFMKKNIVNWLRRGAEFSETPYFDTLDQDTRNVTCNYSFYNICHGFVYYSGEVFQVYLFLSIYFYIIILYVVVLIVFYCCLLWFRLFYFNVALFISVKQWIRNVHSICCNATTFSVLFQMSESHYKSCTFLIKQQ